MLLTSFRVFNAQQVRGNAGLCRLLLAHTVHQALHDAVEALGDGDALPYILQFQQMRVASRDSLMCCACKFETCAEYNPPNSWTASQRNTPLQATMKDSLCHTCIHLQRGYNCEERAGMTSITRQGPTAQPCHTPDSEFHGRAAIIWTHHDGTPCARTGTFGEGWSVCGRPPGELRPWPPWPGQRCRCP